MVMFLLGFALYAKPDLKLQSLEYGFDNYTYYHFSAILFYWFNDRVVGTALRKICQRDQKVIDELKKNNKNPS
jgi:hypothetical protein